MKIADRETPVIEKTKELCEAIVAQPGFSAMIKNIEAFYEDPEAQQLYEEVVELQESLRSKQENGQRLSDKDIAGFESSRDKLLAHPVAGAYLEAQNQIHSAQKKITQYVTRTFELGRVPTESDFQGCCGGGCSCG